MKTLSIPKLIDALEAKGWIVPPFTADERELAHVVSEAYYFSMCLTEMPARFADTGIAYCAAYWGLNKVLQRRIWLKNGCIGELALTKIE